MKFSKNIVILIGSYLGMLLLVSCIAQFLTPLSVDKPEDAIDSGKGNASSEVLGNVGKETSDRPVSGSPNGEPSQSVNGNEESAAVSAPADDDVLDAPVNGGEEDLPVYYLKSVKEEAGVSVPVIGVYDENGQLLQTLDTPIHALPSGDKAMLEVGIAVTGVEALEDLIEDFGG